MQQPSGRARTFETVVSLIILLIMIGTAVAIYMISREYNMVRYGVSSPMGSGAQSTGQELQFSGLATKDLSLVGKAETYNYDNLYEKIDGKAPMYQETGFVQLDTQRFALKSNSELGFELCIYDMNNAKNAFSVYSRQKRADVTDLNNLGDAVFGYVAGNEICLSLGKNYIEIIGSAESNELVDKMEDVAKDLITKFKPTDKDKITELAYFPPQGTVAGSWKLYIDNGFGFDGLNNNYTALYKSGDKTVTIFFSKRKNADEAKTVAKNYYNFLVTNGAKGIPADSEILKSSGASVADFYGAFEIVFPAGVFVGGVHEASDKQAAEKAAEILIGRLKEIND